MKIPDFNQAKVLVVGDVMLDRFWFGSASRISPEAPVPVVHVQTTEERPGGAGNVALNLASLGVQAQLLGLTGQDEAGRQLENLLREQHIDCCFTALPDAPTITKLRVLSKNHQLMRLDFEEGFCTSGREQLLQEFSKRVASADVVIFSDYGKGALADIQDMIKLTRQHQVPCLVDPKGNDFSRYAGASLITPNLNEFETIVGKCADETDMIERAKQLVAELQLDGLLVTRSEKGMLLVTGSAAEVSLPTRAQEVFDVTGAGDTVIAVLAAGLATGTSMADAMRLANLAAGVVVGKLGTATVNCDELVNAQLADRDYSHKIVSVQRLQELIQLARHKGERIVMTNGCFDVLHAGHVQYLERAKKLGARLLVAVNSDESVKRLKGPERPVNILEDRLAVLSALGFIDWLVPFEQDTPAELIDKIVPDVLVKGGDYRPEDIVGYDTVRKNGGEVVVLDFLPGRSTTGLIKAIQEQKQNS